MKVQNIKHECPILKDLISKCIKFFLRVVTTKGKKITSTVCPKYEVILKNKTLC